jgi:ABC-type transport system substrate-binding protein
MANTVLGGAAIPANSQVPPGNSFWANPDLTGTCEGQSEEERFESAKQLLVDAGYTWTTEPVWNADNLEVSPQGEGLSGPDGTAVPAMTLLAPGPGYDPLRATYSLFVEQWARDLGVPLTANPTGFSVIVDEVYATGDAALEWDMFILGWGLTPFPDHTFTFFDSRQDSADGGFNTPGYNNPEFDALADEFARAKTLEEARDLIFAADAILAEEVPYVVLFTTPIIEAYRNTIEFPFTTVLDGVQGFSGLQASTTTN